MSQRGRYPLGSIQRSAYDYIKAHPGATSTEIGARVVLDLGTSWTKDWHVRWLEQPEKVRNSAAGNAGRACRDLERMGYIENRGWGHKSGWYVIEDLSETHEGPPGWWGSKW